MRIPETAQKIARAFRRRGYTEQCVLLSMRGYTVTLEGDSANPDDHERYGSYDVIEHTSTTALSAFRKCEAEWQAKVAATRKED